MVVYTWKDGKQLKERKMIFDEFVKDNKFWHQMYGIKKKCLKVL